MQLLEHLTTWLVGWLSIAAVVGLAWCVCVTRYKARQRADMAELRQRADITRKPTYPPPVPRPPTCRDCEMADDLLADVPVPVDKWLTPELSDRLFDDLIAMEGLQ